jgi:hypothetical protein
MSNVCTSDFYIARGRVRCRIVPETDPAMLFLYQDATSSASYEPLIKLAKMLLIWSRRSTLGFGGSLDAEGWPSLDGYAVALIAAEKRCRSTISTCSDNRPSSPSQSRSPPAGVVARKL